MNELKIAVGNYFAAWHAQLVPTTPALVEYCAREPKLATMIAPGRMVDQANEMLGAWRRSNNTGSTSGALLPVVIIALAKDYVPITGDYGIQVANGLYMNIPADAKKRIFQIKQIQGQRRCQMLIAAAEEGSAISLAQQFILWLNAIPNRKFYASYTFAGTTDNWPINFETTDLTAQKVEADDEKNITLAVIDFVLIESIPLFRGPTGDEPNDGKGDGTAADPNGYPSVTVIDIVDKENGSEHQASTDNGIIHGANTISVTEVGSALEALINTTLPSDGYL